MFEILPFFSGFFSLGSYPVERKDPISNSKQAKTADFSQCLSLNLNYPFGHLIIESLKKRKTDKNIMRITDYRLFNINDDDDTRKIWVDIEREY